MLMPALGPPSGPDPLPFWVSLEMFPYRINVGAAYGRFFSFDTGDSGPSRRMQKSLPDEHRPKPGFDGRYHPKSQ
jgi:hypothetical protein